MKKYCVITLLFLLFFGSCSFNPNPDPRIRKLFDNDWLFHAGDIPGASEPDFDDRSWRILDLPHDWSVEPITSKDSDSVTGPFTKRSAGGPAREKIIQQGGLK